MMAYIRDVNWTLDGSYGYGLVYIFSGSPVPKGFHLPVCQITIL